MNINMKNNLRILCIIGGVLSGFFLCFIYRPVEIIAVHGDGNYSYVLVKGFPITDRGKISWWLKNKDLIGKRYDIPKPAGYGSYNVTFWDFGDGYKEDKYDMLCFDDMPKKINCIDKTPLFTVKRFGYESEIFITYEGRYKLSDTGKIIKVRRE